VPRNEQPSCERGTAQARAGYVECGLGPHSPRADDYGRRRTMTVNERDDVALARRVREGRRSTCTRRDRAAQDRRLRERRRRRRLLDLISRVARADRLRSIASAGKNAPLGKKRNRPRCRLHFSCCNCRARQGNCLLLRRMHVGAKNYAYVDNNPISYTDPLGLQRGGIQSTWGVPYTPPQSTSGPRYDPSGDPRREERSEQRERQRQFPGDPLYGVRRVCIERRCSTDPGLACTPSNPGGQPQFTSGPFMSAPGSSMLDCPCVRWGWNVP